MDWSSTATLASWWGYAEADPTLVGVVVAAIGLFSVVHVVRRVLGDRHPGQRLTTGRPGDASASPSRVRSR